MEVVDELTTPGCPQCAVKHLSAALSYLVEQGGAPLVDPSSFEQATVQVSVAKAVINLTEVVDGYASHFDYAVGLIQQAEERALLISSYTVDERLELHRTLRDIRLDLIQLPEDRRIKEMPTALIPLRNLVIRRGTYALAHYQEALRELPALLDAGAWCDMTVAGIQKMLVFVRENYFAGATEAPVVKEQPNTGEPNMATAKKPAPKKGTVKCACKGGKTKK